MRFLFILSLCVFFGGLAGCYPQAEHDNTYACNTSTDCISGYSCVEAEYKGPGLWCLRVSDLSAGDIVANDSSGATSGGDTSGATSGEIDTSGTTTSGSDTSGTTTSGSDTSGTTTSGSDTSGTTTSGACQNSRDRGFLDSTVSNGQYTGKQGAVATQEAAATCGLSNIGSAEPLSAAVLCMRSEPNNILVSEDCATCYAALVLCTIERCISRCVTDPTSAQCTTCQLEEGCTPVFNTCTGL